MKLMLKGFSQEAELSNPEDIKYMFIFINMETGKEIKLPVLKSTTEALISWMYNQDSVPVVADVDEAQLIPEELPEEPIDYKDEESVASI